MRVHTPSIISCELNSNCEMRSGGFKTRTNMNQEEKQTGNTDLSHYPKQKSHIMYLHLALTTAFNPLN